MNQNNEDKLNWMYKGASGHVDEEEYLLGKSVDKTFEQLNNEKKEKKLGIVPPKNHVEHECIPPSIRDFNKIVHEEQVDLSAKLQEDPLAAIKKQEEEARRQFLQNPIQLKKLQEALEAQKNKKKKKKKKRYNSEDDLDKQLCKKLKNLTGSSVVPKLLKKEKEDHLDTILMHKFNQLKDKLSQKDMDDILAGRCSSDSDEDTSKNKRSKSLSSDSDVSEKKRNNGQFTGYKYGKLNQKNKHKSSKDRRNGRDSSSSSEYERKKYRIERNETKKLRDWSSSNEYKKKNNKKESRKHRDSSSSSEFEKKKNKSKSTKHRDDSSSSENEKKKYKSKSTKHRDDSSSSENEKKKYKRETRKHRERSSSSEVEVENHKKNEKKHIRSKLIDSFDKNGHKENEYRKKNRNNGNSESDNKKHNIEENDHLDKMILEKLRMIRDSKPESRQEECEEEQPTYSHYDSDNDDYVYKKKSFGLVRSDGTKIPLKAPLEKIKTVQKKIEPMKAPEQKMNTKKKLSDKEKEEIRKQMMVDAVERDKERSDNLKKFRQENKKEESKVEDFDKDFIHRQLSKSQQNLKDVESRIKSKLNNIQRSSQHMNSNFSKRS